jgi:alanyl-tRNA synthetase
VRTQDIDEVGDGSHLTFFEMLGNWSLGDYFKEGAITMSYEFLTEVLELPPERIAISCFAGDADAPRDTESAAIWMRLGIPQERIAFFPKDKNWWGPAGKTGPCGPDTEMFTWIGEGPPRGNPATNEAEWLEIWNDVFMEYNRKESKEQYCFAPLSQKNVDTGMGLERVAQVMQGVGSVYETDRMRPILNRVQELSTFNSQRSTTIRHCRIIVDHLRAATFLIADGVQPSNVDRGYVLRRLIRRAIRSAHAIGIEHTGAFTPSIADVVICENANAYPSLPERLVVVQRALRSEEEQFGRTLVEGLKYFERALRKLSGRSLNGETYFHLYDTYGFPPELTEELAKQRGYAVDREGFRRAFAEHQAKSRAGAEQRFAGGLADHSSETTKLHTATHLLQAALRKVLGSHVFQKGSNVTTERLRFDFNHPAKLTGEELHTVEALVNEAIHADYPVSYQLLTLPEAKAVGAIGVFEGKYGERVKVYRIGPPGGQPFSLEICGGPHVARTGMLGSFRIVKEESAAAGIRRIKAIVEGGPAEIEVAGPVLPGE